VNPKKSEILESDEISATIGEELKCRCNNSDALWIGNFMEDSDKEHSDNNTGDRNSARIIQQ
jgi:hypothetical protein